MLVVNSVIVEVYSLQVVEMAVLHVMNPYDIPRCLSSSSSLWVSLLVLNILNDLFKRWSLSRLLVQTLVKKISVLVGHIGRHWRSVAFLDLFLDILCVVEALIRQLSCEDLPEDNSIAA